MTFGMMKHTSKFQFHKFFNTFVVARNKGGENYSKCQLETTIDKRTRKSEKGEYIYVLQLNKSVSTE